MADNAASSWGEDSSEGQVEFLDSSVFSSVISKFTEGIQTYDKVLNGVKRDTETLFESWLGEGRTQFEKDYNTIFLQLKDIGDVLYDLREALIKAEEEYYKTDDSIGKKINS